MLQTILEFFRCPEWFADSELPLRVPDHLVGGLDALFAEDPVWPGFTEHWLSDFSAEELINHLRHERYAPNETTVGALMIREAYYLIRPLLTVSSRRHLQRFFLRKWTAHKFPRWPVDRTVDLLREALLQQAMMVKGVDRVPFIWFWPDGHSSCALMTHDVETEAGLRFCGSLMDLDDEAEIKSSFQFIPEQRYSVSPATLQEVRDRGFEINIHDLNHDGHLFRDHKTFLRRAQLINDYGAKFQALGFRAGALYRNQEWFDALRFSYEMSVPNVAHLDPQHGGCCTLFPYFIGKILELPVTTIQDYSLFHVLSTYSPDLWHQQMSEIVNHHGLISVIAHPDYLAEERALQSYKSLLAYLNDLRENHDVWITKPAAVNDWWRLRSGMKLVWTAGRWSVVGPGSERAQVAYATCQDGQIVYRLEGRNFTPVLASPSDVVPSNALG